jgi:2-oxoglutarate ferredoxin oxidoreductase subunit beta
LTKGQTSPTSQVGFVTKTTPKGTPDRPINPLRLAIASGATFVARGFSGKPKELAELIVEGINHNGFAVIDTFSPCPTFNKVNTFKAYREEVADLPKDYDPSDLHRAIEVASSTDPMYLGVLYREAASVSFEDHLREAKTGTEADAASVMDRLFQVYS